MSQRPTLLVEYVDAAGAAARDVLIRAAVLNRAGCSVRSIVVERQDGWGLHASPSGAGGVDRICDDDDGHARLAEILDESRAQATFVASAAPGGGTVGRWLSEMPNARWWPSAIGTARTHAGGKSGRVHSGPLPALDSDGTVSPGLHWSTLEYSRLRRSQLPLWDGDYMLSPGPLGGRSGETALRAFAAFCESNGELDFVVLSDPQPEFVRMAKELGIGLRVHFAGIATRDAEVSWLTSATAALVVGDGPISAGMIFRALACGCPLLPVHTGALADELGPWLEETGLGVGHVDSRQGVEVLNEVATQSARVAAVTERGRLVAQEATSETVGDRLAAVLERSVPRRRAGGLRAA